MRSRSKSKPHRNRGLLAIAIFKLVKAVGLVAVTVGALGLLHRDLETTVARWIDLLRVDPDNRYIAAILQRLNLVHTSDLKKLSFLTGFYAVLFLIEGVGLARLALEKRWAEMVDHCGDRTFYPTGDLRVMEAASMTKVLLPLFNVTVVFFLVYLVRRKESCNKN